VWDFKTYNISSDGFEGKEIMAARLEGLVGTIVRKLARRVCR
jgi:hypothetical protein